MRRFGLALAAIASLILTAPGTPPRADDAPTAETPTEATGEQAADEEATDERRPPVLDTVYDDARVGREESERVDTAIGLVRDEALTEYVSAIGRRLARHAPRHRFDYTFRVVDQDEPNAFALPGGYVYVSRGLTSSPTTSPT